MNAKRPPACPICDKPQDARFKPFCSQRCARLDLGRWLGGKYAIPGTAQDDKSVGETEEPE